jgi:hypothetical protein
VLSFLAAGIKGLPASAAHSSTTSSPHGYFWHFCHNFLLPTMQRVTRLYLICYLLLVAARMDIFFIIGKIMGEGLADDAVLPRQCPCFRAFNLWSV